MKMIVLVIISILAVSSFAQRSPYAGRNPIGYPEMELTSTTQSDGLGNRFGEDVPVSTERLPLEANGDRELFNRLKKLSLDKQPFWLINWLALEELRNNPQTYELQPNTFVDNIQRNSRQNRVNN